MYTYDPSQNDFYDKKSCYLCQKDNLTCDGQRPCHFCSERGHPHMCMGLELEEKANIVYNSNYGSSNTLENRHNSINKVKSFHDSSLYHSNGEILQPNDNQYYENYVNDQTNFNMYIMNEIRALKQEQNQLNNELLSVKEENSILHSILSELFTNTSLLNQIIKHQNLVDSLKNSNTLSYSIGDNVKWSTNPLVVLDLRNSFVSVISANEEFCELFGYTIEEVMTMSWTNFIHPNYIDRTKQILLSAKGSTIRFNQCYILKNGDILLANDIHTLIYDSNGHIKIDIVQILPIKTDIGSVPNLTFDDNIPKIGQSDEYLNDYMWPSYEIN